MLLCDNRSDVPHVDQIADLVVKEDVEDVDLHNSLCALAYLVRIRLINQEAKTLITTTTITIILAAFRFQRMIIVILNAMTRYYLA